MGASTASAAQAMVSPLTILYVVSSGGTLLLRLTQHDNTVIIPPVFTKIDVNVNPYPTAFPYGNGMVLHFYQQQESSTTKTVYKVINKGLKAYV